MHAQQHFSQGGTGQPIENNLQVDVKSKMHALNFQNLEHPLEFILLNLYPVYTQVNGKYMHTWQVNSSQDKTDDDKVKRVF